MSPNTPLNTARSSRDLGLDEVKFNRFVDAVEEYVVTGQTPAIAFGLARDGWILTHGSGYMNPDDGERTASDEAIFLTASVSKPVTCTAVALLIERGAVSLEAPVEAIVPEFTGGGREKITVHQLLTHTSGLPDMIPENMAYRKAFRPLSDFIERICTVDLLFEPGTGISYQSTGIAMLGEVVLRVTGMSLPDFLKREIFEPLGMWNTGLGNRGLDDSRIPIIRAPDDQIQAEWHWNRAYWRNLGVPWGGMFSTVGDISTFLQLFLNHEEYNGTQILSSKTVDAMTSNHTDQMEAVPPEARAREAWGLGWRLNRPQPAFGAENPPSPGTYGHFGATGTMVWADPETGLSCAIFTTEPKFCGSAEFQRLTDMLRVV